MSARPSAADHANGPSNLARDISSKRVRASAKCSRASSHAACTRQTSAPSHAFALRREPRFEIGTVVVVEAIEQHSTSRDCLAVLAPLHEDLEADGIDFDVALDRDGRIALEERTPRRAA